MREIGMMMSAPMVRAFLEGRKTVTRRPIKPQPTHFHYGQGISKGLVFPCSKAGEQTRPPVQPGDLIYVRETWREQIHRGSGMLDYLADYINQPALIKWRPSIHM